MNFLLKLLFGRSEKKSVSLLNAKSILVIWQHNQLGDLIVSYPLYRAIKEKFPSSQLTVVLSPANYRGLTTCPYIDKLFVFDKKQFNSLRYIRVLFQILRQGYDLAIVPSVVSLSFTSNLLAGISKSRTKIGTNSLNGKSNESSYFFDYRVDLDWRDTPEKHVAERTLDIIKPIGITTTDLHPKISANEEELSEVVSFINSIPGQKNFPLIGLHIGAGKPQNRWHHDNFAELINHISSFSECRFYFTTGGREDFELIKMIQSKLKVKTAIFDLMGIPKLYALIEKSNLFITNDTGPMHVAAATDTPVISLFGPTNPQMWRPLKENKIAIKKAEDINSVTVESVLEVVKSILCK